MRIFDDIIFANNYILLKSKYNFVSRDLNPFIDKTPKLRILPKGTEFAYPNGLYKYSEHIKRFPRGISFCNMIFMVPLIYCDPVIVFGIGGDNV